MTGAAGLTLQQLLDVDFDGRGLCLGVLLDLAELGQRLLLLLLERGDGGCVGARRHCLSLHAAGGRGQQRRQHALRVVLVLDERGEHALLGLRRLELGAQVREVVQRSCVLHRHHCLLVQRQCQTQRRHARRGAGAQQ